MAYLRAQIRKRNSRFLLSAGLIGFAGWILLQSPLLSVESATATRTGYPQLISVQRFPELQGAMCETEPASASASFTEILRAQEAAAAAAGQSNSNSPAPSAAEQAAVNARPPLRTIKDSF